MQREAEKASVLHGEVVSADTLLVLFRLTFVFVALAFSFASSWIFDLRIYTLTTLFLILQGIMLVSIARRRDVTRVRPFAMLADIVVFCAWMWAEPRHARSMFSLFYLTVPMTAMAYRLRGSIVAACLSIGAFMLQATFPGTASSEPIGPVRDRLVEIWRDMASTQFIPLLLVALATGVLAEVWDREREARFARETELFEHRNRMELMRRLAAEFGRGDLCDIPGYEVGFALGFADHAVGGGDYIGVQDLGHGVYAVCVADISGKTLTGIAKLPLIRWGFAVVADMIPGPAAVAGRLNALFCHALEMEDFITAAFAALDVERGAVETVAAGQVPPLYVSAEDGTATYLPNGGPALGVVPGAVYRSDRITMSDGDVLAFCSDGIVGAVNEAGEELSEEWLAARVSELRARPATEIASAIRDDAVAFAAPAHRDDVTVLVLRRVGGAQEAGGATNASGEPSENS